MAIAATLAREAADGAAIPPKLGGKGEARKEAALLKAAVVAHRAVSDAKPFWSGFGR